MPTYTHAYSGTIPRNVTLTVRDVNGVEASITLTVDPD